MHCLAFLVAGSLALLATTAAMAGPLSGVWKNEQDGFLVRIDHEGRSVRATLLADHHYPDIDVWPLGETDFVGTISGVNVLDLRERIIWHKNVKRQCPSVTNQHWANGRLFVAQGRLIGTIDGFNPRTCQVDPAMQRKWSYVRITRSYPNPVNDTSLQPLDAVASDCTPGQLLKQSSDEIIKIRRALDTVKYIKSVVDAQTDHLGVDRNKKAVRMADINNKNEYFVFIVTDGTGNHDREYVGSATQDAPDACRGVRHAGEIASGVARNQYVSNARMLSTIVEKRYGPRSNVISVYERGVGTGAMDNRYIRGAISSGRSKATTRDFHRVVDNAYANAQRQITEVYKRNPNARFSFVTAGFSRGAAAARIINNKLWERGILHADRPGTFIVAPKTAKISTILYDTVVSLDTGLAGEDPYLASPAFVNPPYIQGLHIVAENEYRDYFPLTSAGVPRILQLWVPGAHSDIGGTYTTDGISAVTLQMGLHYLEKIGIPVSAAENFGLPKSQVPNWNRMIIHDSRYSGDTRYQSDETFDKLRATKNGRVLETKYDPSYEPES